MNTWKVILATLVIYSAGILTGTLLTTALRPVAASRPPTPVPVYPGGDIFQQRFLDRLKNEVELTPEQIQRLEMVFKESRERMKTWWEIIGPEMQAEIQDVRDRIRLELTPEQREQFEKLIKKRHQAPPSKAGEKRSFDHRAGPSRSPSRRSETNNPAKGGSRRTAEELKSR